MSNISIFENIKQSKTDKFLTVDDFLIKVKFGYWKDRVIEAREMLATTSISKERGNIKGGLPNVTISGKFHHRNAKKLVKHSGFIALDIDKIENMEAVINMLVEDQYTYGLFKSISGKGLCVIVRIPVDDHLESFKALQHYYLEKFSIEIDKACKDVSRSRIVSWDQDTFINKGAQIFEMYLSQDDEIETKTTYDNTKIDISIKFIEDRSIDITDNYDDWVTIGMAIANTFGEKGRDNFHRISAVNPKYDKKDCDAKYDDFLKNSRGEITIGSFYHYCQVNNIPTPIKERDWKFWKVAVDSRGRVALDIDNLKFNEFLTELGYRKYYHTEQLFRFVRIKTKLVEPVSIANIRDHVKNYVGQMHGCIATYTKKNGDKWRFYPRDLLSMVIDRVSYVFAADRLSFLDNIYPHDFPSDTKDSMFFFFKNGIIKVTRQGWKFHDYEEADKLIWKDRVKDYEFRNKMMPDEESEDSIWRKFISCITSNEDQRVYFDRYNSLRSILGYILHDYYDGDEKSAILTDEDSDGDNVKGRTGKSLLVTACGHMRDLANIAGKNFDYNNKFKYQKVKISTQVISINDLRKGFDMERFFNDITEGVEVEYKNKDQFDVKAKFLFTMNRTPKGQGDSFDDRYVVFELTNFFSAKHKPIHQFGKMLFIDFDDNDWFHFYDFMFKCCQHYLDRKFEDPKSGGIDRVSTPNALRKKLIANTKPEFVEFIQDTLINKDLKMKEGAFDVELGTDIEINTKQFFEFFKSTYEDYNKTHQRTFTNWLRYYSEHYGHEYIRGKHGSTTTFIIKTKKP